MKLGETPSVRSHVTASTNIVLKFALSFGKEFQLIMMSKYMTKSSVLITGSSAWLQNVIYLSTAQQRLSYCSCLSMNLELSSKGIYIQAVLPAGTYTELWDRAGIDISGSPKMMEVNELVDAALIGFDRREQVTIPPLHNAARWDSLDAARQALLSDIQQAGMPPDQGDPGA